MSAPHFSLILCTAGTDQRIMEIDRLLASLTQQKFTDFEVIVVDQNDDFDMTPLLAPYQDKLRLVHITSPKGLSRSRNKGMTVAAGTFCAFPDDDCWYAADILQRVADFFAANPGHAGLQGKGADPDTGRDMARFDTRKMDMARINAFEMSVSCALFYKSDAVRQVGGFDEDLGLGSGTKWTGCEDYDIPIRLLDHGMAIHYDPALVVYHPCPAITYDASARARAKDQSPSFGYLISKHRFGAGFAMGKLLRPFGGVALSLLTGKVGKAGYHWAAGVGRVKGYLAGLKPRS